MAIIRVPSIRSFHISNSVTKTQFSKPNFLNFHQNTLPSSYFSRIQKNPSKFKLFTSKSSPSSVSKQSIEQPEPALETKIPEDKFDWYSQWYPIIPVCDLDKRVPHAKKVLGIDIVVWWDRNDNAWKVFDDSCPHRLAPLSEGRIDQFGRLQCVYHGWCFNGSGDCGLIPQAPSNGPPVHTFKKACASVYPSTVHHDIVWFWPNTDPQYKDILTKKKPPFIPELADPSFSKLVACRDMPYGYDVLVENLMDPAHLNYAHYGIVQTNINKESFDREGGRPLHMGIKNIEVNGFIGKFDLGLLELDLNVCNFMAPCVIHAYVDPVVDQGNGAISSPQTKKESSIQRRGALVFLCIPVSPGNSRLIVSFPRNFGIWIEKIIPRWIIHVSQNLLLDSDLFLLHVEERKIMDVGPANWQKACFVPTKSDVFVVGFRRWLNKYAGGQVDWRGKYNGALPSSPPKEQLMDRYWSHVVNCSSCKSAYNGVKALEVILQVISIASISIMAAASQSAISAAARATLATAAVACFAASRWLAHFIYKSFHYSDYNHALH